MIAIRTRGDMQQSRGLEQMHPMPFPFGNDAGVTRPQFKGRIGSGVHSNGHPSGKNQNELITVRMPLTVMRRITRHVGYANVESIHPRMRTALVFNRAHTQIPTDGDGVP